MKNLTTGKIMSKCATSNGRVVVCSDGHAYRVKEFSTKGPHKIGQMVEFATVNAEKV